MCYDPQAKTRAEGSCQALQFRGSYSGVLRLYPPGSTRNLGSKGSRPQHLTPTPASCALGPQESTQGRQKCLAPVVVCLLLGWADLCLGFIPSAQAMLLVCVPLGTRVVKGRPVAGPVAGTGRSGQGVQCGVERGRVGCKPLGWELALSMLLYWLRTPWRTWLSRW